MKTAFEGKNALVIGGSSGMGKATAQLLLTKGVKVTIASKSPDSVAAGVAELKKYGQVEGWTVDLRKPQQVDEFIQHLDKVPPFHYLVNASGFFAPKPFVDSTAEDYASFMDINRGFFFITQAIVKRMQKEGIAGSIVNIGSYWATHAVKGTPTSTYTMAKAGLHALTQQLAMELAPDKIRVNAIAPGIVETGVLDELAGSRESAKEVYKGLNAIHPLGRNGQPSEIASAVTYLLSDEAAWITGAIWAVDGGMSAGRS
ncbi:MAG: SDR family oxidoreductase [Bacteroidetes bacterium]|nr:SDR family oxidoreductase [Bacteroidota bacterium]